jgi:thiol-disulfide isomerase/thioredoxin
MSRRYLPLTVRLLAVVSLFVPTGRAQSEAETRVVNYIREHLQPGQPLLVTELYGRVFTQPDERKSLDKLYNAFFRIPLFTVQYQDRFGRPPTLKIISEQFDLKVPGEVDTLLRVMESDPRVPRFLTRDAHTGEITRVDTTLIKHDERFGKTLERQLAGWEGKTVPDFRLPRMDGRVIDSTSLRGKVTLLYIWFTGCPPCMQETPELVQLDRQLKGRQVEIVAANADRFLGLDYDASVHQRYLAEHKVEFPVADWTKESDGAFGHIAIFPTLFLIDRHGIITGHWVGFVSLQDLRAAILRTLEGKPS